MISLELLLAHSNALLDGKHGATKESWYSLLDLLDTLGYDIRPIDRLVDGMDDVFFVHEPLTEKDFVRK